MSEYGHEYAPTEEIEEGLETSPEQKEADPDLINLISQYKEQLEHVYRDADNKEAVNELLAHAQEFIDAENKAQWMKLLKDTKDLLQNEDDEMAISDILREAKSDAESLM